MNQKKRVAALETQAQHADRRPWVRLVWGRGQQEPEVPAGRNAIIRRLVAPGDLCAKGEPA